MTRHPLANTPLRMILLTAAVLMLAGCSTRLSRTNFPEITFRNSPPIAIAVAEIVPVSGYVPPASPPNVEHLFPQPPGRIALRWPGDRLAAAGNSGTARYVVLEASVVESDLAVEGGIEGAFTDDQSERYDATVVVELEILDAANQRVGIIRVIAKRSTTVAEAASVHVRERAWFALTEALMNDLDQELERTLRRELSAYLL